MHVRCGLTVIAVVLAGCGPASAGTTTRGGGARPGCAPAGARLLAADPVAEVYEESGTMYGCEGSVGHRYRLGTSRFCNNADLVGPVALSARLVAYGLTRCGIDTGEAQVVVRRLTDGKLLHTDPATSHVPGAESYQSVGSVVVKTDGAVAWIGAARSIIGRRRLAEVHRLDGHGQALLDQGAGIAAGSLLLHGSRLSWTNSNRRHTATLD